MFNQPQQKPAPTFGAAQDTFTFRFRSFQINDQFTIVEDMPRSKPVRTAFREKKNPKPGQSTTYKVCLIRVNSNNFEADLEIYEEDFTDRLAIACPKNLQNFKGVTLAYDGRKWVYICQTEGSAPISQPQQPQDQKKMFMNKLVEAVKGASYVGDVKIDSLMKIAEKISPGNALELIKAAKDTGALLEGNNGVYVVVE